MSQRVKVLNLYAGIGGNRKLWQNVDVTAIEIDEKIAGVYKQLFPNDTVVVGDAHKYLLEHYKEFDFIWSSPPCPTHSVTNNFLKAQGVVRYPDMSLWQEIIFLKHFFKGKWVVENVKSYYEPIMKPFEAGRHYFWSNFIIGEMKQDVKISVANARASTRRTSDENLLDLERFHDISLEGIDVADKRKLLRNCVQPKLALHVFNMAYKQKQERLI